MRRTRRACATGYFYPRPPRGGRPGNHVVVLVDEEDFYPRPPRGGRLFYCGDYRYNVLFLSTPPARRATAGLLPLPPPHRYFYPRPPRGGRHNPYFMQRADVVFLSTPPARRATGRSGAEVLGSKNFYPRPPRGGRHAVNGRGGQHCNFYPRPPRGGRQNRLRHNFRRRIFLSTPPARRATQHTEGLTREMVISIHAPREEGDST